MTKPQNYPKTTARVSLNKNTFIFKGFYYFMQVNIKKIVWEN